MTGLELRRARTLSLLLGLIVLVATACRAPGQPPRHPDVGVYRDVIRREADSTHTALATARILITTADTQGLPGTYARVTLRSMATDLRHVVVDLNEIRPPAGARLPQKRLTTIASQDAILLKQLQHHWDDHALRQQTLRQVTRHANEIERKLDRRLDD